MLSGVLFESKDRPHLIYDIDETKEYFPLVFPRSHIINARSVVLTTSIRNAEYLRVRFFSL